MSNRSAGDATAVELADDLHICRRHVALHHVERGVAEDPLQADDVTTIDEIAPRKGVAQRVRAAAPRDPARSLRRRHLLHPARIQRATSTE